MQIGSRRRLFTIQLSHQRGRQMTTSHETAHWHFVRNLQEHVAAGAMTQAQMDDSIAQKALFDANRETIKANHDKKVVGYCSGEMYVGDTMQLLLAQTKKRIQAR